MESERLVPAVARPARLAEEKSSVSLVKPEDGSLVTYLLWGTASVLVLSILALVAFTWKWGMFGDATLLHYEVFLAERGWVPYRDLREINPPGSYLPLFVLQKFFHSDSMVWRCYDLVVVSSVSFALYWIARESRVFLALWGGSVFAAIHVRDGIDQVGQRDLEAAAILLLATALLLYGRRSEKAGWIVGFGVLVGLATTIKPVFAIFLLMGVIGQPAGQRWLARGAAMLLALAGWIAAPGACLLWLLHAGAARGFWYSISVLAPYHASLGRLSPLTLLNRGFSPLLPLLLVWTACAIVRGNVIERTEWKLLGFGALLGLVCLFVQGKGYPYHRYPMMAFLLAFVMQDMLSFLSYPGWRRGLAAGAVLWTSFWLVPSCVYKAQGYEAAKYGVARTLLEADLEATRRAIGLGSLDHEVQCIDSVGGCIEALDHMRIEPATGALYDEFLFHDARARAVRESRDRFLREMHMAAPAVIVMTDRLFPDGPDGYVKLSRWPEFSQWLDGHYKMILERRASLRIRSMGGEVHLSSHRIYVLR